MKNLPLFPTLIIIIISMMISGNSSAQWIVVNTGFTDNLVSISLGDDNRLFSSGTNGHILLSDDGGDNWYPANISGTNMVTHVAMQGTLGYAVTDEGFIYITNDNGDNWNMIFNTSSKLRGLFILDPSRVFASGQYEMLWDLNHGLWDWIPYVTGPGYWLRDIHFPNQQNGYVVGDGGRAYKTPNSAYGWFLMNMKTDGNLTGIYFPSPETGYCSGLGSTLLKTVDGGINWESVYSGPPIDFWSVHFFTNDYGYVSATNGNILKTTDGGQTWIPDETTNTVSLREFCYVPDLDRLLVGGLNGTILYKDLITNVSNQQSGLNKNIIVSVFPNPFEGKVRLEISGLQTADNRLIILNAQLQEVISFDDIHNGRKNLDLAKMPPGSYYYQIISKDKMLASGKLVSR